MKSIFILLLSFSLMALAWEVYSPVTNFHQVDENLYRSGQPQKDEMSFLKEKGIKTIINLRNVIDDKQEIKGTGIVQVRIPMRAKTISYEDIVTTLCAIEAAEKPALIHCLHGSDRTGCMVAAYRMTHGMSKADAIAEFQDTKYGYNKKLFPNILVLLESIDPEKLKKDVNCAE